MRKKVETEEKMIKFYSLLVSSRKRLKEKALSYCQRYC